MWIARALKILLILLLTAEAVSAEVVRIDIQRRDDFGTYERLIGRVYFAVDPLSPANRGIADVSLAPRNAAGLVEFSSDLLLFRPKGPRATRGTVFLEVVNRGRDQSLALMSGAGPGAPSPESWDLGDRFVLTQGFTLAFLGWQFDVRPTEGLTFQTPTVPVKGTVRADFVETRTGTRTNGFSLAYCAADPSQPDAQLTFRTRIDDTPRVLPRERWRFGPDGCAIFVDAGFDLGVYEARYQASGSPVAGLGMAAVRDFGAYLKYGAAEAPLRENPAALQRVLGFGYSQSGRFLREFVRDGFNADEQGRRVFDGLMIASAGAGGGSFNHRFASPGEGGNSVLSILRPVDVPPFNDDGLLAKSEEAHVTPKIFYTFSSTEYWARAGSLTQTSEDGRTDVPFAPTSRLYFLSGTAHSAGPLPPARAPTLQHTINFAEQQWALRALLLDLDAWIGSGTEPPPSRYPTIAKKELVPREAVKFPKIPALPFATYLPQVWRMDFGPTFATTRVITNEPPLLGGAYPLLVPQVDADGNDVGGVRLPEVAAPVGTYTGWNVSVPQLADLHYLAGLVGSFEPFDRTSEERDRSGDRRESIEERYGDRQEYLARVTRAAQDLVRQRFMLADDVRAVVKRADAMWSAIVGQ